MIAATAHDRLRGALRAKLNGHYGRIGEIEQGLDRAEGYLGKYCRGEISIPVDVLLKCLELIEVEPGQFFCQALGAAPDTRVLLQEVMASEPSKGLDRLQKAAMAASLEMIPFDPTDLSGLDLDAGPRNEPAAAETRRTAVSMAKDMMSCSAIEQRRRLRSSKKYRNVEFAHAYLARVLRLSYSDPKLAAKQAEVVSADLVPAIEQATPEERLELIIKALGIYCFANRVTNSFEQAALGVHFGLTLATAHRLDRLKAELLRVGAYVLVDTGQSSAALQMLGEAIVIFGDLGDLTEVAKLQVQRGGTLLTMGEIVAGIRVLHQGLAGLPQKDARSAKLYRLAACQRLADAYELASDLDSAESWLERAIALLEPGQKINRAKLTWQIGRLCVQRGALGEAEVKLFEAFELLVECQASECTLAALDLTKVLLALEKPRQAVELARGMAHLVSSSRNNPLNQGVLSEFIRAAIEGELSLALVDRLKADIGEQRSAQVRR